MPVKSGHNAAANHYADYMMMTYKNGQLNSWTIVIIKHTTQRKIIITLLNIDLDFKEILQGEQRYVELFHCLFYAVSIPVQKMKLR